MYNTKINAANWKHWLVFVGIFIAGFLTKHLINKSMSACIDHVSYAVKDFDKATFFYDTTLAPLKIKRLFNFEKEDGTRIAGYGSGYKPSFWISHSPGQSNHEIGKGPGLHIAFKAPDRDAVDQWYLNGLNNGATDNGAPGLRPEYHRFYYGGFLISPDGWKIEACLHTPHLPGMSLLS